MKFGLFGSAQAARSEGGDVDSGAGFKDFIESNVEAEALGYHSTFLVEHHFTGLGQISASLNLLTWLGARTTTLRLGTAVMVLPWHNPVLLSEQVATLDLLSGGRVDFGIGKGYRHNEFAGFCIPMEEAEERFEESIEVIKKAWTSNERFSHHGKFWKFEDIIVEPPTAQYPHPPIWMGAGSAVSIKKVAQRGYSLLLDQFASVEQIGERIQLFKSECKAIGREFDPMSVAVARSINVTTNEAEREQAIEKRLVAKRRQNVLAERPDGNNKSSLMAYSDTKEMAEASALYGTPDEILEKIEALHEVGVAYILCNSAGGRDSMRRFAKEVIRHGGVKIIQ